MKRTIAITLLASISALCNAQDSGVTKLQCEGTYDNYTSADMRDAPVKGIYLEISGDRVKVLGTVGFDATYSVITRRENGVGFQLESNPSYGGFLNRFSGQLSLMEKGAKTEDGGFKLRQVMSAVCGKAKSLF
jgi:hypothetical protein